LAADPYVVASSPACTPVCPDPCPTVFDRVVVSYLTAGGTLVTWELLPTFTDPGPLTFQLQVGSTDNPDADDWVNVGLPMTDAYFAVDPERRAFGKTNYTNYRVVLTTALGTYTSEPTGVAGTLSVRDWKLAREIARKERLVHRLGSQNGYLLKRRWTGVQCDVCTDFMSQEPRNAYCPSCYGTGFQCGYYYPMACVWANMQPRSRRTELDGGQTRGTVDDIVIKARMLLVGLMGEDDVWVSAKTDDRYYVHRVQDTAEIRGFPIVGEVELRPIAFSSIIYSIPIPEQLAALLPA
jgi:hypothetical protein